MNDAWADLGGGTPDRDAPTPDEAAVADVRRAWLAYRTAAAHLKASLHAAVDAGVEIDVLTGIVPDARARLEL